MAKREIAGHTFYDFGPCSCGIHWSTIRNTPRELVGEKGIAHSGTLTVYEYEQIERERNAEDNRITNAMAEIST